MESENYKIKYLKYKQKYLNLKEQHGGILYKAGKYIFFFNSSILSKNTPLLNNIEAHSSLPKVDFNKITDEIAKSGETGWYYYKGLTGASSKILKIESTLKVIKSTSSSVVSSVGKSLSDMKASRDEKNRLALCEKCKKAGCELVGGNDLELVGENYVEFIGGTQSAFKIDVSLLKSIKTSKDLSEDSILDELKSFLENNGIVVDRAIVCNIGLLKSSIIKYKTF